MHAAQPALPDLNTTPDDIRSLLRSLEKSLQNIEKKVDNLEGVSRRAERLAIVACNSQRRDGEVQQYEVMPFINNEGLSEDPHDHYGLPCLTHQSVIDDLSSTQLMSYLDGYVIAYPQGASHQEKLWKLKLFLGVWVGN